MEQSGDRDWSADEYFTGGGTYGDGSTNIKGTVDDELYFTERNGIFSYEIPVETGDYEVILHFAELYWTAPGQRLFNVDIESTTYTSVDIFELAGGKSKAFTLETPVIVSDGHLSISLSDNIDPKQDQAKLSAIEVKFVGPHLAHSVANGPYKAVDIDNDGVGVVRVDGSLSHTHGTDLVIVEWKWKRGPAVLGQGKKADLLLPVGEHVISLTVTDDGGNDSTEETTVTVRPFGYPAIASLSPSSGSISGYDSVTIIGSGFTYPAAETVVHFGLSALTGNDIQVVDEFTIKVLSPPTIIGAPASVTVTTPLDESNSEEFTYVAGVPIEFTSAKLFDYSAPTVVKFGPDGKLYVGSIGGHLGKLTLNKDHTQVLAAVISTVAQYEAILGIAFDPLSAGLSLPPIYISTSFFFHGEPKSSSGNAINGKIRKISGNNLDVIETVISGLPVSDHDHGVNAIEFGDHGELYINIGSNTNGGKPGQLTGSQLQKENYFSAATLVAHMGDPLFDGRITYSAPDNGTPNGGHGIEVFAAGTRNPYGLVLHSNGNLYGTDNGPNLGYGDMLTGCGPNQFIADVETEDKINLLVKGGYYGHPNPKRASANNEPRQCVWRNPSEPSDAGYTEPLVIIKSSTDGIIEWQTDHFDGQLRGNLITSKYYDGMHRVVLTPNGQSVIPESNPPLSLGVGDNGLDLCQSPSGVLIEARPGENALYFHKPNEPPPTDPTAVVVKGVFPRRGSLAGGSKLSVYGINLAANGQPTVTVGTAACPVVTWSNTKVVCTLPGGIDTVSVSVQSGAAQSTFENGYRYVSGIPQVG